TAAASTALYSLSLHDALPILAFFGLPFFETERPEPTIIPVEIVPEAELADITTPKPAEEPAPTPPEEPEETQAPPPEPEPEPTRSEEHTSELQSRENLVCRLL